VVTRPGTGERYVYVCRGSADIGRNPESAVPLLHPFVSRDHLVVTVLDEARFKVHDRGSRNGTVVNGRLLRGESADEPSPLTLQVGPFVLQLAPLDAGQAETMQATAGTLLTRTFLDRGKRQLFIDGRLLLEALSANEFAFLDIVSQCAPNVADRTAVGDGVWGEGQWDIYMLHNLVSRLRRRIGSAFGPDAPEILVTVPGVGFRLI
jgi:DNA-binding response OmpR family regulator